jgi:hypothetical protein
MFSVCTFVVNFFVTMSSWYKTWLKPVTRKLKVADFNDTKAVWFEASNVAALPKALGDPERKDDECIHWNADQNEVTIHGIAKTSHWIGDIIICNTSGRPLWRLYNHTSDGWFVLARMPERDPYESDQTILLWVSKKRLDDSQRYVQIQPRGANLLREVVRYAFRFCCGEEMGIFGIIFECLELAPGVYDVDHLSSEYVAPACECKPSYRVRSLNDSDEVAVQKIPSTH